VRDREDSGVKTVPVKIEVWNDDGMNHDTRSGPEPGPEPVTAWRLIKLVNHNQSPMNNMES
jgi:hypothetical protein